MALSWSEILGIFIAILAAQIAYHYFIEARQQGSLSASEKNMETEASQTIAEYVKSHYRDAVTVES